MMQKKELERRALKTFALSFNSKTNRGDIAFIRHRDPPYPDLECRLNEKPLFVEVAHVFGSSIDSRSMVRHGTQSEPSQEERQADVISQNTEERIIVPLNSTIAEHCMRDYTESPLWLLDRIGNPIYDLSDLDMYKSRVVTPVRHPFDEIWLMCGPYRDSGAVQLWSSV